MSALMVNDTLDFNALKELLELTGETWPTTTKPSNSKSLWFRSSLLAGNQAQLIGRRSQGRDLFRQHLAALEQFDNLNRVQLLTLKYKVLSPELWKQNKFKIF